jgi:hypothetical protein
MSCNAVNHGRTNINYENVGPYGNSMGSFAPLDTAYTPSLPMSDFQKKMSFHGPSLTHDMLLTQNSANDENANINNNIQMLLKQQHAQDNTMISPQSEEKINSNVDMMLGTLYNRDNDFAKQDDKITNKQYLYPHMPIVQNGINFPLTRAQYYSPGQHGSELLEDFNPQQNAQNIWENANTSQCLLKMSFFKFLLLIILIAALIYGIYLLYKNGEKTHTTTTTITKCNPGMTGLTLF